MRCAAIFAVACILLIVTGCRAPQQETVSLTEGRRAEVHYAPAENLEHIDADLLRQAKTSIDFAAYSLTDLLVGNALIEAAHRGVHIRIYRDYVQTRGEQARADKVAAKSSRSRKRTNDDEDDDDAPDTNDLIARLSATPNIELRIKHSKTLMHLKSYCIDNAVVRSGSANFSPTGEKRQDNDLILMRDEESARRFQSNFNTIWQRTDNESPTP